LTRINADQGQSTRIKRREEIFKLYPREFSLYPRNPRSKLFSSRTSMSGGNIRKGILHLSPQSAFKSFFLHEAKAAATSDSI
jgi:hypothetical protein